MGWLQYARILCLSRGYHYILYINILTAQVRANSLVIHKRTLLTVRSSWHGEKPVDGPRGFQWQLPLARRGPVFIHHADRHVDVFKDFPGGNPPRTIGGFHEVIPWLTVVFTTECVHEGERFG